ncbi:MAG: hypothetical protein HWQ42_08715 [Nostoc sp. JL23]|nr:hypothetical protein [Nostoc sp. JL23]
MDLSKLRSLISIFSTEYYAIAYKIFAYVLPNNREQLRNLWEQLHNL